MAIQGTIDYPRRGHVKLTNGRTFAAYGRVMGVSPADVRCVLRYPDGTTVYGEPLPPPDGSILWGAVFAGVQRKDRCALELEYRDHLLDCVCGLNLKGEFAVGISYPTSADNPIFTTF